jgi:hypothetical protein
MQNTGFLYKNLFLTGLTGSQEEPGNRCPEALPRSSSRKIGGRADGSALPGKEVDGDLPLGGGGFTRLLVLGNYCW